MALPSHVRLGDRITERDPFPYRLLQRCGVTSRKQASVITLVGLGVGLVLSVVLVGGNLSTSAPAGEPLPLDEQLLLDDALTN